MIHRPSVGDAVLVEGVVTAVGGQSPTGTVAVNFPFATDPSWHLDGVDIIAPDLIVFPRRVPADAFEV